MKNIVFTTNFRIQEKADVARKAIDRFLEFGAEVILPGYATGVIEQAPGIRFVSHDKMYENADLIVVVGGDGTILEAARRAALKSTPILGINKGRLGYMTAIEVDELDLIEEVMKGNYYLDARAMLDVELRYNGKPLYVSRALNDAVISNGSVARVIDLQLKADNKLVGTYRADGLIVTTPSGSTAYSLSAGGPIIAPNVKAMCVTPICSHSFGGRPLIFPDESVIEIKNICDREPHLYLTVDGRINIRIMKNQTVRVTKSDKIANLVRIKEHNFYSDLCNKLGAF
jgi:NAD+ kinase